MSPLLKVLVYQGGFRGESFIRVKDANDDGSAEGKKDEEIRRKGGVYILFQLRPSKEFDRFVNWKTPRF